MTAVAAPLCPPTASIGWSAGPAISTLGGSGIVVVVGAAVVVGASVVVGGSVVVVVGASVVGAMVVTGVVGTSWEVGAGRPDKVIGGNVCAAA
jgi:hypothetical protein